jgi:choline dehydrogenase-like flavoprotein
VRAAVNRYGVGLRSDAVVSHLIVGEDGKARGVAFVDRLTKRAHEIPARAVALCASTLESTRILLNTTSRHHPNGMGNSSDALGRYLMDHPGAYLGGFLPGDRDASWDDGFGGPRQIMVPRFHNLENRAGGAFLRGYGMFGHIGRLQVPQDACEPNEVPFAITMYGEMLPRFENRVVLDREHPDAWGIPSLFIDCAFTDNERALVNHMVEALTEMIHEAHGRPVGPATFMAPGGFVHEVGTARMGASAKTSVLNAFAQCWDAPNVYVMDGAAWTSAAWQNPTFTMMAIAGRASEHLANELKQGRL